jgi:hypothetical protein
MREMCVRVGCVSACVQSLITELTSCHVAVGKTTGINKENGKNRTSSHCIAWWQTGVKHMR